MAILSFIITILLSTFSGGDVLVIGCYTSIFSFGDSLADTGNLLYLSKTEGFAVNSDSLPFGQTYFHRPTGRFSDGRLIIDFLAQHLGLELIPPYLSKDNRSISKPGINFAVGGATAMNDSFFDQKGILVRYRRVSLTQQQTWFSHLITSHCRKSPSSCKKILNSSLFLMGEIGGNDYNHAFTSGKAFGEIQTYVDPVVHSIGNAITELIEIGARTIIVPGNFPMGCIAIYLEQFSNSSKDPQTGCILWLNEFSQYHNQKLQAELDRIRDRHQQTTIIYADYYNSAMAIHQNPKQYGFKEAQKPCCTRPDGVSPDELNGTFSCHGLKSKICEDPSEYINWDDVHLTEAAYKWIFKGLLENYSYPLMKSNLCNGGLSSYQDEI